MIRIFRRACKPDTEDNGFERMVSERDAVESYTPELFASSVELATLRSAALTEILGSAALSLPPSTRFG